MTCSMEEARAILTAPGARYEMEEIQIRGVPTRTWKYAPATVAVLVEQSRLHGDRPFSIYETERVSYAANFKAIAALGRWLQEQGVGKGDRVGLAMRNLPEWPVIFLAALCVGAIAVPLNAWCTGAELAACVSDAGAGTLFCDSERYDRIAQHDGATACLRRIIVNRLNGKRSASAFVLEDIIGTPEHYARLPAGDLPETALAADDDAAIFYTSGTSGKPKGVLGTHRNLMTQTVTAGYAAARSVVRRGSAPPAPAPRVRLMSVPLFHVTGCIAYMLGGMQAGNTNIYMRKWDTLEAIRLIARERVNLVGGVAAIAIQLLDHSARAEFDLSSLDSVAYGGAPAPLELGRRIHTELGAMPGIGWGMTETMSTVTALSGEDYLAHPESCGPAVPVADLRITGQAGEDLPPGAAGELWAKGPMVAKGYWNDPAATAAAFAGGWVRTGDLARLDREGFCTIVDRAKDVIIRGGENIYSLEVEAVLQNHPAVQEAALIGLAHHTLGEEPAAVVLLAPGCTVSGSELRAWVGKHLAAFKVPVRIAFTDSPLPRNEGGKLLKAALRDRYNLNAG